MRQEIGSFAKGGFFLFLFVFGQSLLGRWMIWSWAMPEGDFALFILLSYSMGWVRGTLLGSLLGVLRGIFSNHPFGLGVFVLAGVGLFSGYLGENRRLTRPWQKTLFIFLAVLFSENLLLCLRNGGPLSPIGLSSYYLESVFPSAMFSTLVGWMGCFLL